MSTHFYNLPAYVKDEQLSEELEQLLCDFASSLLLVPSDAASDCNKEFPSPSLEYLMDRYDELISCQINKTKRTFDKLLARTITSQIANIKVSTHLDNYESTITEQQAETIPQGDKSGIANNAREQEEETIDKKVDTESFYRLNEEWMISCLYSEDFDSYSESEQELEEQVVDNNIEDEDYPLQLGYKRLPSEADNLDLTSNNNSLLSDNEDLSVQDLQKKPSTIIPKKKRKRSKKKKSTATSNNQEQDENCISAISQCKQEDYSSLKENASNQTGNISNNNGESSLIMINETIQMEETQKRLQEEGKTNMHENLLTTINNGEWKIFTQDSEIPIEIQRFLNERYQNALALLNKPLQTPTP